MMMVMRVGSENVCIGVVLILLVLGEGRGFPTASSWSSWGGDGGGFLYRRVDIWELSL